MFVAHIQTAAGPLTIGLTNITLDEANATFSALVETLAQVTDPIIVTSTDVYLYEAPEGSPATMTFKYLGPSIAEFENPAAYAQAMNKHLELNVFACAMDMRVDDAGGIAVDFESFELLGEAEGNSHAALH